MSEADFDALSDAEYISKCIQKDGGALTESDTKVAAGSFSMALAKEVNKMNGTVFNEGCVSGLSTGYYLVVETGHAGKNADGTSNSAPIFVPVVDSDVTATPKHGTVTSEKKIVSDDHDNDHHADVSIGDTVKFELDGSYADMTSYDKYAYTFHDTMSEGLTLKRDTIKVYLGSATGTEVTDEFTVTPGDNGKLTIACPDLKAISGITATGGNIVVTYEAVLNESAHIGITEENPNEMYVEYSNDPYSNGTGTTKTTEVEIKTYSAELDKTDKQTHKALENAEFELHDAAGDAIEVVDNEDGTYTVYDGVSGSEPTTKMLTDNHGKIVVLGLNDGKYQFVETKAPDGYRTLTSDENPEFTIEVTIPSDGAVVTTDESGNFTGLVAGATNITYDATNQKFSDNYNGEHWTAKAENVKGVDMPFTGQQGIAMLSVVGAGVIVVSMAAAMKRRNAADAE